mmetsp:Transcript_4383/g.13279  ORF Transcript_4383/g.13279 Transcript_4383/m.13279 type:complete len:201 (-) Transcript_4383:1216-1818(-)
MPHPKKQNDAPACSLHCRVYSAGRRVKQPQPRPTQAEFTRESSRTIMVVQPLLPLVCQCATASFACSGCLHPGFARFARARLLEMTQSREFQCHIQLATLPRKNVLVLLKCSQGTAISRKRCGRRRLQSVGENYHTHKAVGQHGRGGVICHMSETQYKQEGVRIATLQWSRVSLAQPCTRHSLGCLRDRFSMISKRSSTS